MLVFFFYYTFHRTYFSARLFHGWYILHVRRAFEVLLLWTRFKRTLVTNKML